MYKLSFKLTKLGIIAPIIFAGAAIVLPQQPMLAGGNSFHISVLFASLIGVALIGSMILYDRASKVQKYQAFLMVFALTSLYGALGNLFYNFWKWAPGEMVEFSWAQLIIMNLGGLITTFGLLKLEPFDQFASGGLERLQKGKAGQESGPQEPVIAAGNIGGLQDAASAEDFMKSKGGGLRGGLTSSKTDMQAAVPPQEAVMPKKTGPTSLESAQAIMTPPVEIDLDASDEMLSGPLNPSPTAPAARTGAPAGPADPKGNSATGNRLQAQKRRNTSTFTKLQALSASGTGSLKPTPVSQDTGGGDLRSLLDRLDSEEESQDYEALPKPEEIRIAILFGDEKEKPKTTSEQSRPQPTAQSKPQPLAQPARPAPKEPARPVTPPRPTPATTGGAGPGGDKGMAARAPQPQPKPIPAPLAGSPGLASLLDRAEALADSEDDTAVTPPAAVVEPEVAPKEEVAESSAAADAGAGLLARRFMEMSGDDDEEDEPTSVIGGSLTKDADAEPVADEPSGEEEERDEKLFAENVDEEIDDIFTSLAPADSQREVSHEDGEEETREVEGIKDDEIPAAPEESEPEVAEEPEPEPEVEAEPEVAPEPEEEAPEPEQEEAPAEPQGEEDEERVFAEGVDGDIDDIFTNLAPADAQRNVGDVSLKSEEEEEEVPAVEEFAPAAPDEQEMTGDFPQHKVTDDEAEAEPTEGDGESESLFALGDSDVDDIFAGLAGDQLDVNAETLKKVKDGDKPEPPIPASLVETGDRIPVISADKKPNQTGDMPAMKKETKAKEDEEDESEEEEKVEEEAVPDSPEAAKLKKELKEFGKLSGRSANAPKVSGESVGTMKTIGKLLIDNQAIENIIKAGEQRKLGQNLSTARIISSARGQGIMELLHKIDTYEGVVGSIIVGHDGLVMASTLKDGWDKDIMGALSTALLSTSNLTTKKLEIGKLRQMVMLTRSGNQDKTTVLTDVDVGILAVFVEETDISKIDGMLDIIHKTIHG